MAPTTRNTTRKNSKEPVTADAPRVTMVDAPARPEVDEQIRQNERDINDLLTNNIEPIPYYLSAAESSLMGSINDEQMMGQLQDVLLPRPAAPNNQSGHGQHASTITMNQQQQYAATSTQHGDDHGAGTTMRYQSLPSDALARVPLVVNDPQQQQQQQQIGHPHHLHRMISVSTDASSYQMSPMVSPLVGPSPINCEPASLPSHGVPPPAAAIPASVSVAAQGQGSYCLSAMSTENVAIASEIVKQEKSNYQASMAKRTNDLDEKSAQHRQHTAQIQQVEVGLQNALDHQEREHKVAEEQEKANDEQVKTQLTKYQDAIHQKNMDTAHASEQDKASTEQVAQKELAYEKALLQQERVLAQVQQAQERVLAQVQQAHLELRYSQTQQRTNQQESMTKHHSNNAIVQQEKSKYHDAVARQNTDQERAFTQDQANKEQVKKHKSAYQDHLDNLDCNQWDAYVQHRANSESVQQNLTKMDTALADYSTAVLQRRALANQVAAANQAAAPVQPMPNFQAGVGADNSVPVVNNAAVLQLQAMIFSQLAQQQLTTTAANAPNSDMSNTANANANANANASKKRKSPP